MSNDRTRFDSASEDRFLGLAFETRARCGHSVPIDTSSRSLSLTISLTLSLSVCLQFPMVPTSHCTFEIIDQRFLHQGEVVAAPCRTPSYSSLHIIQKYTDCAHPVRQELMVVEASSWAVAGLQRDTRGA